MPFGMTIGKSSRVTIDIAGDREFAREMFGLYTRAMNMKPVMDDVVDILRENVRQQYMTNGFYGNTPWKPLNRAYLRMKERRGLDTRIMLATHALYDSLAHTTADSIAITDEDSLTFGSSAKTGGKRPKSKLALHQSRKPRTKLPRRPPVSLNVLDEVSIVDAFRDHIIGLRRAGLA